MTGLEFTLNSRIGAIRTSKRNAINIIKMRKMVMNKTRSLYSMLMIPKAVKELDNDKVNFETYCATGDKDISQALQLTINGVRVSLFTCPDNRCIVGVDVKKVK